MKPSKDLILIPNNPTAPRICPELAEEIGLNESILLLQIDFWIRISSTEQHDGRDWTYQSIRDIQETFRFWSIATINRTLQSLIASGYLIVGNFNRARYDRTRWFSLNPEKIAGLKSIRIEGYETRSTQNDTPSTQDETTIPEIPSETSESNEHTPEIEKPCLPSQVTTQDAWNALRRASENTEISPWAHFQAEWRSLVQNPYAGIAKSLRKRVESCAEMDTDWMYFGKAKETFRMAVLSGRIDFVPILFIGEWEKTLATQKIRGRAADSPTGMGHLPLHEASR